MHITLNGEPRSFSAGTTLTGIIQALELDAERVAIEMNRAIVKREAWAATEVTEGAEIEVVMFVGGG